MTFAHALSCCLLLPNACTIAAVAADTVDSDKGQTLPRVFSLSPQSMAETKSRVAGNDASLKPAIDRLRKEARKALKAGPFSVMDKPKMPPSGDKHDYLSLAPYFWPNSDAKDGLPYIRRDGQVNPQSKVGTDSPPMGHMSSAVQTLALAYYLTGEKSDAEHAAKLLRVWFLDPATRMNPNLNFGQGIPGQTTGRPTGIIDTAALVGVVDAAGLLELSSDWSKEDRQGMIAWCEKYLDWLRTSKIGKGEGNAANNHATWYDVQVVALALYSGHDDLARKTLEAAKHRRIDTQIEPDGSQPFELARTKSFGYSLFNLRALFALASLGDRAGVDLWHYRSHDGRSIRAALDAVAPYASPEKTWPHKELHFDRTALLPFLRQATVVYHDPRYRQLLEILPTDATANDRSQLLYAR